MGLQARWKVGRVRRTSSRAMTRQLRLAGLMRMDLGMRLKRETMSISQEERDSYWDYKGIDPQSITKDDSGQSEDDASSEKGQ
jgi:hypothetical protein